MGMESFLGKLKTSLKRGRGVTLPTDPMAARNVIISTIFANDSRTLEELLDFPEVDINYTAGRAKRTYLLCAIYAQAYECVSVLIKKGADISRGDVAGFTPFLAACRNGNRKIVKKLIALPGLDVYQSDTAGLTGMHWLAAGGRHEVISDCLLHVKEIDRTDDQGQTALHISTKNGHVKVMELLINNGANIQAVSNLGVSPLHFACNNGRVEGVELLLAKGAANLPDSEGHFPMQYAVEAGHYDLLPPLMNKFVQSLNLLVQLISKDVEIQKLVGAIKFVLNRYPSYCGTVCELLTEMAINAGLKLLTLYSIIDVEMFTLSRSITVLKQLTSHISTERYNKIQKSFIDVWSTLEAWFNLLNQKIQCTPDLSDNQKIQCMPDLSDSQKIPCTSKFSDSQKKQCSPELSDNEKPSSPGQNLSEVDMLSPRICCALQAFYSFSVIGHGSDSTPDEFLQFIMAHQREIEFLINRNPSVIFENFDFLLSDSELNQRLFRLIKLQPFSRRKEWFYKQLYQSQEDVYLSGSMEEMLISRDSLFTSSCHQLLRYDPTDLKRTLNIRFNQEDGLGPGVVKEWFNALSQELLNPDYALFVTSPDGCTFQPNYMSNVNPDHLNYFNFAGQVIGLALYHKHLINVYFTRSFYKHILGLPVNYTDVESIDPEYARNLQWILDNDISDLGLDLTFTIENNMFGVSELVHLVPNGDKVPVTDLNKSEYVQLVTELKMTRSIQPQIDSFLQGFHKFIPQRLTKIFDEYELEILLSGIPDIDIDDWKKNTDYIGYCDDDKVIQWFWEILENNMEREERVQILQFTTGSSRVPFGGFGHLRGSGDSEQKFTISKSYNGTDKLPTASTCVNMVMLPDYESKEDLLRNLHIAIECSTGFGLA